MQRKGRKEKTIGVNKEDEKRHELAMEKQKSLEKLRTRQSSSMDDTVFLEDSSGNTGFSCSETITSAEDIDIDEPSIYLNMGHQERRKNLLMEILHLH